MIIKDHINFARNNPLIGAKNEEEVRFPDMSKAYTQSYIKLLNNKLKI